MPIITNVPKTSYGQSPFQGLPQANAVTGQSPMYQPQATQQFQNPPGTFAGKVVAPAPQSLPRPQMPESGFSPFIQNLHEQIKVLNPEEQQSFLQSTIQDISSRLARYNYRLSRGRSLEPNQQAEYESLKRSLREIQEYQYDPETSYFAYAGDMEGYKENKEALEDWRSSQPTIKQSPMDYGIAGV
jgi:hypothetical protein